MAVWGGLTNSCEKKRSEKHPVDHILSELSTSMKRQKDMTLKDELPRSVGAQYATGEEWRNNSRKNEEMEPKQKQHSAVDGIDDGSKLRCSKE